MVGGKEKLQIGICGTRGIPACYGGFETFAEELSTRLASRGHHVTVYGRSHVINYSEPTYRSVKIKLLWAPRHKYLETPVHTILSLLDARKCPYDVLLVCNAANSPFLFIPRMNGQKVALNVDGIERLRGKWNILGRIWYRLGEVFSVILADAVVADADVISDYYERTFRARPRVIRYGCQQLDSALAESKIANNWHVFQENFSLSYPEYDIKPGKYILYVSRLEPENNAHIAVEAYNNLAAELKNYPLLIVGDAPYAESYIRKVQEIAGPNVFFLGYRFGKEYLTLQANARCYIQGTEVGGTHPALVESMGFANAVIANGTPENKEVLGECGRFYSKNNAFELARVLEELLKDETKIAKLRAAAYQRACEKFSWDVITREYEALFYELKINT